MGGSDCAWHAGNGESGRRRRGDRVLLPTIEPPTAGREQRNRMSGERSGPIGGHVTGTSRRIPPAALITCAVVVLGLPSAVLAFSTRLEPMVPGSDQSGHRFAARDLDPSLARAMANRPGNSPLFRFTPAGLVMRPDRAVTVAVRVDAETAREITVRGFANRAVSAPGPVNPGLSPLRIAPTAYNLGVARGFQGFAQPAQTLAATVGGVELRKIDMPDLSSFKSGDSAGGSSRLAPHIALDERERPGRAPRTLESIGTQTVDLGGSYRLSRNIDVTAGVRYSRDRDRLQPVIDGKTDSQAVFVGTQFKF